MFALLLLITACTLLWIYLIWHFNYWKRKCFPSDRTCIPFGALDSVFWRKRSPGMAIYDVYLANPNETVVGTYMMFRPVLLVRDAQLARDICSKDFESFHDRGTYCDEEKYPATGSLFMLRGNKWKTLRTKMRPFFTSGRLKSTFDTAISIADKLIVHLNEKVSNQSNTAIEMKSLMTAYALDILAPVFFGLEVDSFADPNNEYFALNYDINDPGLTSLIRGTAQFFYPDLEKIFMSLGWAEKAPVGMEALVQSAIAYREQNNDMERKDFLQLLIQLRNSLNNNKKHINKVEEEAHSNADELETLPNEMISINMFLYYVAGYETTSSAAAFTLYELTQYPEVLAKLQQDIAQALQKHGGVLSYEALQDMKYLELCIMETGRKYPALPMLNRECTRDYVIPGTNRIIKKGMPILISLFGMHRDAEHFPEPMRYDPERFLDENMNYNPVAYMPFGEGPRHCIAQLMGKLNVKIAVVKILSNFNLIARLERSEIEMATYGIPLVPKEGVCITLSKKGLTH